MLWRTLKAIRSPKLGLVMNSGKKISLLFNILISLLLGTTHSLKLTTDGSQLIWWWWWAKLDVSECEWSHRAKAWRFVKAILYQPRQKDWSLRALYLLFLFIFVSCRLWSLVRNFTFPFFVHKNQTAILRDVTKLTSYSLVNEALVAYS